jgi:hypothetical protein
VSPTLLSEQTWANAVSVQYTDLDGIVPGYGRQVAVPLGARPRSARREGAALDGSDDAAGRHAGHFGQSGTFLWFHRPTGRAAVVLTDRAFGPWAKERWDGFNDRLWE